MSRKLILLVAAAVLALSLKSFGFAQPPPGQETSGIERLRELQEREKSLREKVEKEKKAPQIEEKTVEKVAPPAAKEKILAQKIDVVGVTLLSDKEIKDIILPFTNKELTLAEMQKIADLITDAYRQKGYITSRAYLPPQKIKEGILELRVLEGLMGEVQVKGNRYFKTGLLKRKITLTKGEPFNYNALRKCLAKINEHPDRSSRAVLMPGKEPGATDLVLEVKDRLPIHIGLDWDNFGSRYIEKDRYAVRFTHNNLLGLDDKLTFQYQLAQEGRYFLKSLRYLLPASHGIELGIITAFSRVKLGQEFKDSDARGKSQIYGLFANKSLIDAENLALSLNLGFDYKDTTNYQSQTVSSTDRARVLKCGFDIDTTDQFGRTLISNELDWGIPDIMGGLTRQDSKASRSGAGGKFVKDTINLLRLQKMPFSSQLLWKNQIQLSPYILTASEQFQIGGIANVRGYPPAEVVGDRGYSMSWEWSFPPYLIPKKIKVPFSKAKLYDAIRVAMFYDWATSRLRRPTASEEKNKTLRGAGCGLRFNLPEDFSLRLDLAWPLDNTPSDGDHLHTWVQVSKSF